nr:hypothetical protein [Tanacetum cinerariifolium]
MTTVNQGMSVEEIERFVAQRVAIAIYETKTNLARKSMSQTKRQEEKVAENASNKRKWESNHNGSLSQQNKGHKCKSPHSGPFTVKYGNCKKVGHIIQNFRTPATAKNQRTRTFYECGNLRHYKNSNVELKEPMEDQPLPADTSPTALSPGYVVNSEDKKDPKEAPADYPVDKGNNDDDESSNDDDNVDDVEKDEEDKEEEEHLAPADPSNVPIDDLVPSS